MITFILIILQKMIVEKRKGNMAKVSVMMIIGRAVTDTDFRELFYNDLEKVFSMYPDLTGEEKEALKAMPKESAEKFASELDERISKGHCDQF